MTDGKTHGSGQLAPTAAYAQTFNRSNIEIIAVGITPDYGAEPYSKDELLTMAQSEHNLIEVSNFDAFKTDKIADKIYNRACEADVI